MEKNFTDILDFFAEMIAEKMADKMQVATTSVAEPQPKMITRREVCSMLHISLPTLHSYINKGLLNPYKVGDRRVLFDSKEVEDAIKSQSVMRYKHN